MKNLITIVLVMISMAVNAQDSTVVLSSKTFGKDNTIALSKKEGWVFKSGNDSTWADTNLNTADWKKLKPADFTDKMVDKNGKLEGWFRLKIKLDSTLQDSISGIGLTSGVWAASDVYINGKLFYSFGNTGLNNTSFKEYNATNKLPILLPLNTNEEYIIAVHFSDKINQYDFNKRLRADYSSLITITAPNYANQYYNNTLQYTQLNLGVSVFLLVLMLLFWLIYFQNKEEKHLFAIALTVSFLLFSWIQIPLFIDLSFGILTLYGFVDTSSFVLFFTQIPFTVGIILNKRISKVHWVFASILLVVYFICIYTNIYQNVLVLVLIGSAGCISIYYIISARKTIIGARWAAVIGLLLNIIYSLFFIFIQQVQLDTSKTFDNISFVFALTIFPISLLVYVSMWFKETRKVVEENASKILQITEEKKELLEGQNIILEKQVTERTRDLNQSLENLKSTQSQLIQSEKMASLGELTAGIAHEIQNPLNFVNNFSELSSELMDEIEEERTKSLESRDEQLVSEILGDLKQNLSKITHHGKRADSIVKGMLEHSRTSTGEKALTDLNVLADEFLRLSYHGIRAKDKRFNADFKLELDPNLPKVAVVSQDIGRVLLNLINNAFYACSERNSSAKNESLLQAQPDSDFKPLVTVSTKKTERGIEISVADNGNGIPKEIKDKIFQPFFTTKPTGQGTGLGLSLSYDIVKAHGGELKVTSGMLLGTRFLIELPIS